ncbi:uncharacterized protein LOC142564179 isoform X1 [Dermacentor variabilis]|uniref:uncharacterized protein LOC142564179 isoform X1 n=1 Tax=Dermacentor variabilis TaxID=34621 RepID=UPI003F5BEDC9
MAKTAYTPEEEAARRDRQRELARKRARRRRANPEVREGEADGKRLRREANPEAYAREVAAQRQRMQADPELRARKAKAERQRMQADPELRARKAEAQRQRREADPEVRARDAETHRQRRNKVPELRESEPAEGRHRREIPTGGADGRFKMEFWEWHFGQSCKVIKQNLADCSRHRSVPARSTTVMQGDAATQCDQKADIVFKSTWCEEGISKSTQTELFTLKVSRWTQSDDLEESCCASPLLELPLPKKAVLLLPSNSRRTSNGVQQDAEVDNITKEDYILGMDADTALRKHTESSPIVNAGSAVIAYACTFCSLKFEELEALTSHVLTCPWPEPFQCVLCSQTCADWTATLGHLTSHLDSALAKCPFCEYIFDGRSSTIMRHMQRLHVRVKAFMCNFCRATFVNKHDILAHSRRRCRARKPWE